MNHIEMGIICSDCKLDCKTAHADGSCALADYREPRSATKDDVEE